MAQRHLEDSAPPARFGRGDLVRLTRDLDGVARGAQGIVIGWYANRPGQLVVHLWSAGVREIATDALEAAA